MTPGMARAAVTSIDVMRACAYGERTKQHSSAPSPKSSVERPRVSREAFDSRQFVALSLDGEHQARSHRSAIQQHRAAAAHAVLAADVGAGQPEVVAEEVGQKPPRVLRGGALDSVDFHAA